MSKRIVLTVLAIMLCVFGASIVYAGQVDGMQSGGLAGTAAGLPTGSAVALTMSVAPNGLGDALIFPYYNARGAYNYFRIVNTSVTNAMKVRVRFREAKRSKEVLDFNVCLSNKDEWAAWVFAPTSAGPAAIMAADVNSTTGTPAARITLTSPSSLAGGAIQPFFFSATDTTPGKSLADVTADDTMEGYFEVLTTNTLGGGTETTHVNFTQADCDNVVAAHPVAPDSLIGNMVMFNTTKGSYTYNATAIADCAITVDYPIANESPTFANCTGGLLHVDYVLTKQNHIAMYNLLDFFKGETEVVVMFPTKWLHWTGGAAVNGMYPYNKPFDTVDANRCEPIYLNKYDSEEHTTSTSLGFSPGGSAGPVLCNEVNVIKIGNSAITNSKVANTVDVSTIDTPTYLGWLRVGLDTDAHNCGGVGTDEVAGATGNSRCLGTAPGRRETVGLPSLGLVLQDHIGILSGAVSTNYNTLIINTP